ncbi:MAG: N-acetylmuramoyl-L-alanine amidase [Thermodesulfobacteriota bacterium]
MKYFSPLIALTCLFFGAMASTAHCATDLTAKRYSQAAAHYHTMVGFKKQTPEREQWLYSASLFKKAYESGPDHEVVAPKALYMLGKVYNKSFQHYRQAVDLKRSADYFEDLVYYFPDHDLAIGGMKHLRQLVMGTSNGQEEEKKELLETAVASYSQGNDSLDPASFLLDRLKEHARERSGVEAAKKESAPPARSLAMITGPVRYWSSDNYTRLVIETSSPVRYKEHMLRPQDDKSRRLYVDLFDTRIPRTYQNPVNIQDGLLTRSRAAQFDPSTTRVVLDMTSVERYKIFSLLEPFRVVIDVYGQEAKELSPRRVKRRKRSSNGSYSLAQQLGLGVKTVIIDAGHGGKDPGAIGITGLREKDVSLRVARKVSRELERKGYKTILTRDSDTFIPLEERTAIANTKGGDLFISIHANSAPNRRAFGLETFYLSLATTPEERAAAAMENAISTMQISALQDILNSLMKNAKIEESRKMAAVMQGSLISGLQQDFPHTRDLGVKKAPFIVLIGANMPAVLTEIGFISNRAEEKRLRSSTYLNHLAYHIAAGVDSYSRSLR